MLDDGYYAGPPQGAIGGQVIHNIKEGQSQLHLEGSQVYHVDPPDYHHRWRQEDEGVREARDGFGCFLVAYQLNYL